MFWTRDRVAFELETCSTPGAGPRLVEVPPVERASRAGRPGTYGVTGTVQLDAAAVRALFDGSALERCQRRAALLPIQFAVIFGRACEYARGAAPHYRQGILARGVGRTLTHPIVIDALRDQPQWILVIVAEKAKEGADPEQQIRAAAQARVDRANARALRAGR